LEVYVKNNIPYQVNTEKISVGKMQFTVTHRRPKYSENDRERVDKEIESQLFDIFKKYENSHN